MSDGLLQFLRDQCNADHAIALLACATGGEPDVLSDGETPIPWRADHAKVFVAGRHAVAEATSSNRAMHIARHDPARVLAEVEAKRMLLDSIVPTMNAFEDKIDEEWGTGDGEHASAAFLRAWSRVYRDHPDFDPAWLED